uniref:Uncharacterized protein n=1 Tax=Chromera velia CCMP2878 TaxID=1169474 RepID=A0A0G4HP85_9ALVE|mmetsp:Transcript_53846/g.105306  ORF Transcript_53846/g.105306 Transcript_53846/m.105306 type:complete len:312 (+) Transcript_53846:2-937(+)|eukprot:Cvel_7764.t1-p1 / transcript=Cvel_7764.t1 / gene=Cvel_7764 / organism=Chromera_velia_CCMP2878 / gene_product=hypothetical protein / transcript_product=hypothetical protein / location=Cvel_scaffold413:87110-90576(-) / protein_length=311 / sequence_SO=supercontig / SO=protein_coding / is_pseudo=false
MSRGRSPLLLALSFVLLFGLSNSVDPASRGGKAVQPDGDFLSGKPTRLESTVGADGFVQTKAKQEPVDESGGETATLEQTTSSEGESEGSTEGETTADSDGVVRDERMNPNFDRDLDIAKIFDILPLSTPDDFDIAPCPGERTFDSRCNNTANFRVCAKVKDSDYFNITNQNANLRDQIGNLGYSCVDKTVFNIYVSQKAGGDLRNWRNALSTAENPHEGVKIYCRGTDMAHVYPVPEQWGGVSESDNSTSTETDVVLTPDQEAAIAAEKEKFAAEIDAKYFTFTRQLVKCACMINYDPNGPASKGDLMDC